MATEQPKPLLGEVAEDAVGFGAAELRLTRDLVLRPRAVMDAYDASGSTAGGRYPKPLRYYLALNGVFLLFYAVTGGFERSIESVPPGMLEELARSAGKSVEETLADIDQWSAFFTVPVFTILMAAPLYLLIRRWSGADDRTDFHQTFTFLNLWMLWQAPLMLLQFAPREWAMLALVGFLLIPAIYALFGRGRWWRTSRGAWVKGAAISAVTLLMLLPGMVAMIVLVWAAVRFLP